MERRREIEEAREPSSTATENISVTTDSEDDFTVEMDSYTAVLQRPYRDVGLSTINLHEIFRGLLVLMISRADYGHSLPALQFRMNPSMVQ